MAEQRGFEFDENAARRQPAAAPPKPVRRGARSRSRELTDRLQGVLETEFFDVWVEGEVSNLSMRASGHWYFSLKDDQRRRSARWSGRPPPGSSSSSPQDGMKVLARGARARSIAPRGEYQISVEVLEPLGKGSLQQAFEDLKEKLGEGGALRRGAQAAAAHAAPPHRHRDLAHRRRHPGHPARAAARATRTSRSLIYPARVQGPEAARRDRRRASAPSTASAGSTC